MTLDGSTKSYTAKLVGTDPTDDVALLQIEGVSGLPTVTFGNSSNIQVGDAVVAIGNALALGSSPTVTTGIISAENRTITARTTRATARPCTAYSRPTPPSTPATPVVRCVDSAGDVIGMNTAGAGDGTDGTSSQNIGFTIPSNEIVASSRRSSTAGPVRPRPAEVGPVITGSKHQSPELSVHAGAWVRQSGL